LSWQTTKLYIGENILKKELIKSKTDCDRLIVC
jgi:hypothetical protein